MIQTYRRYTAQLTAGIDFLRSALGVAWAGTVALVQDALAEGTRQAFITGLPGHPEQTADSLDQCGAERELFRYRNESQASWAARVRNAWQFYEQAGTPIQVLRAVNEWGSIVFPATWDPTHVFLVEGPWARFSIFIEAGVLPWQPPVAYGSGIVYGGADVMYGVSNAKKEDIATLLRVIKKWKPARSKGNVVIVLSGHVYGEPGLVYGGGAVYGPASVIRLAF